MNDKGAVMMWYMQQHIAGDVFAQQPKHLTASEVLTVLWPLNEIFQPDHAAIRALPYKAEYEPQADQAIEEYIQTGKWLASLEVKRVLLERHTQAIMALTMESKVAAQKSALPVAADLPDSALFGAAILHLLYQMKLPFPVNKQ